MLAKVENIVRDVRIAVDMNRKPDSLISEGDLDTLELEEIIESKVCEGIDLVHLESPLRLIDGKPLKGTAFTGGSTLNVGQNLEGKIDSRGVLMLKLPDDFLRLIVFRIKSWHKAVFETIDESDSLYTLQGSKWKGVYGTNEKPIVALTRRGSGDLILEAYSGNTNGQGETLEEGAYIGRAKINDSGEVEVSRDCYRSAIYRIGSLAMATVGETGLSNILEGLSKGMLDV